jgi:serine/threonine protein kinase, bacterial
MPLVSGGARAAGLNIVRLLGRGQTGELYLTEHPRLPRQLALKILPADLSADPEYRFRFKQESDLAAALWHPHIVGLYDRGKFEGRLWLSMDYVDGTDAAQLLTDTYPEGMPPDLVVQIVSAIADALDYAHEQGLVHRYVNPSNILLTNSESDRRRILLAGFGVARRLDEINSLARANLGIGTVSYAAPEQLMDDAIDGRTDQYALAGTAFHLLTGSPPFQHMNPAVVISKHLNKPPPRPGDVRPELTYFDAPFARALNKSPSERFRRCLDFAKALEARGSHKSYIPNARPASLLTAPAVDNGAPTEPAVTPPPAAAVPAPPPADVDDAITFAESDVWSAAPDDTPKASPRRLVHMAALVATIMTVALGGFLGVMALRSASQSEDTSPSVETPSPSSASRIPPPRPAPATAIPPPMITTRAHQTTTVPTATASPAATTTPPTSSASAAATTAAPTTMPSSSPPTTTPAGPDTRPAVGMPCGATGTTTASNSGIPVICVNTPGGSAWEPPGG